MAKAQLTNAGLTLLTNAQGGSDTITFTKMALGDGKVVDISVSSLTALVSQKAEMPIVSKKFVKSGTYQIGAYFSNENITTGFYWRETGIFAKGNDGEEILYCYVNVGDAPDYISVATDIRLEKYIYQTLSVGNSTTINITVNESEMLLTVADIGVAGGVAPLNEDKKIDGEFLPDMNYVPIGADGKIDAVYLPEMDYIPTSEKGQANGVTPLDANGKVPSTHLPEMNYAPTNHNHINANGGFSQGTGASANGGGAAIGINAKATNSGGAVGQNANTESGAAIGAGTKATSGGAIGSIAESFKGGAIGNAARTGDGFAGGYLAKTVNGQTLIDAIQLGTGTNPNSKTLQIYDYQLLDALGKIPTDRIPTTYRKIIVGSYVGTGSYVVGQATPTNIAAGQNTIQLPSYPRLILIKRRTEDIWTQIAPNPDDNTVDFFSYGGNNYSGGQCTGEITADYKFNWYALTQSWGYRADFTTGVVSIKLESIATDNYANVRPIYQLNWEGNTYDYIAFCD